jgi:hypothetical protein
MNKTFSAALMVVSLAAISALSACAHKDEPDADALNAGMKTYLAERGDLCLAKTDWPIDVTQHEVDVGARNARQMPALERLGLVTSGVAEIDVDDEGTLHHMKVRRFMLTDAGRKFYIPRGTKTVGGKAVPVSDFCAAHLRLDKIVGWKMQGAGAERQALVRYTYQVDPAPWTADAEIQAVFPVVAGVVRNAGKAELQEAFRQLDSKWVAIDVQGS